MYFGLFLYIINSKILYKPNTYVCKPKETPLGITRGWKHKTPNTLIKNQNRVLTHRNPFHKKMGDNQNHGGGFKSYVLIHNIAKRHNVGTLARSATAFGVSELILVGRRDFNSFGSHGSTSHLPFRHFYSLSDARAFLKVIISLLTYILLILNKLY